MSSTRPSAVVLSTTLDPVAHGALGALAARESGRGSANRVLERLVREEVERLIPGAWDVLVARAAHLDLPAKPPREVSAHVSEELGRLLRARATLPR